MNEKKYKRSLSEALQAVDIRKANLALAQQPPDGAGRQESSTTVASAPARAGKRLIGGHFDKSVSRQLRELAAREDTTVQALLAEAINMLFASRSLPEITQP
jgi:hypothetical protein